ncbi:hypothetical protein [Streptomyces sp. NPDC059003]|uniref:hypothetical protein n=1 Tax=Streptomyces sp. NPDC059003 TaxID=3346691 RepID=UPI00367826B2
MSGASRAQARLRSEQALISTLIQDVAKMGPLAQASSVRSRDFGNIWLQQMYGALVEDGLWNHPYVTQASGLERVKTVCLMLRQRLQTRMQTLADGLRADADVADREAKAAVDRARTAHGQAEDAREDTNWQLENFPAAHPMCRQAQEWEAQAWANATIHADTADHAVKAREQAQRRAAQLQETLASLKAWEGVWEAIGEFAFSEQRADPQHGARYARQVLEHGIAERVHQLGQELTAQVQGPGATLDEQIAAVRAAMDRFTAEPTLTAGGEPIVPAPVFADLTHPQRWQALRVEEQVVMSLVAHPEQLAHGNAAALRPRDMSKPEHHYLLAAVIEQHRDGVTMDPTDLTHRAWEAASRDDVEVDVEYLISTTMTARHHAVVGGRATHPMSLNQTAQREAPVLIALSVQRQTAMVVKQTQAQLAAGSAPHQTASLMRNGLAHVLDQAQRHPQAAATPQAPHRGTT